MPVVAKWVVDYPDSYYRTHGVSSIHNNTFLNQENISLIEEGDIVFVKTDFLKDGSFQQQILPNIQVPFVLISGVSSNSVDNYESLLNEEKILKWFCTNPPCEHEKVVGIPIGFEEKERDGGNQEVINSFLGKSVEKNNRVLLPYHNKNTNIVRGAAIDYLKSLPFVDVQEEKLPFKEYLELMSTYKYCVCLEGSGFDTHRNYESLLVGTVPIMKNSGINLMFNDYELPLCFIGDWKDIDDDFYELLESEPFDFSNVNHFLKTKTHMDKVKNQ